MNDLCGRRYYLPGALEPLKRVFLKCLLGSTWTSQKNQLMNTNGFYDALPVLLETMMKKGF
jgi:hypothetical protein